MHSHAMSAQSYRVRSDMRTWTCIEFAFVNVKKIIPSSDRYLWGSTVVSRQRLTKMQTLGTVMTGVIGNLASPVYGTPAQNKLAILEPPSKIHWGNLAPCSAPLGELGTPWWYSLTNWIADLIWRCQSWLTCVAIWRACGALLVIFIMADYAAEIKVWSDGEAEREEITN